MARSVRINSKAALALLRSSETQAMLKELAEEIAESAGGDASGFAEVGENRSRGVVVGSDRDALLAALGAARR